ncbi:MAG: hypothetical protein ACR2PT_04955 [Endozoicomonas sp.]
MPPPLIKVTRFLVLPRPDQPYSFPSDNLINDISDVNADSEYWPHAHPFSVVPVINNQTVLVNLMENGTFFRVFQFSEGSKIYSARTKRNFFINPSHSHQPVLTGGAIYQQNMNNKREPSVPIYQGGAAIFGQLQSNLFSVETFPYGPYADTSNKPTQKRLEQLLTSFENKRLYYYYQYTVDPDRYNKPTNKYCPEFCCAVLALGTINSEGEEQRYILENQMEPFDNFVFDGSLNYLMVEKVGDYNTFIVRHNLNNQTKVPVTVNDSSIRLAGLGHTGKTLDFFYYSDGATCLSSISADSGYIAAPPRCEVHVKGSGLEMGNLLGVALRYSQDDRFAVLPCMKSSQSSRPACYSFLYSRDKQAFWSVQDIPEIFHSFDISKGISLESVEAIAADPNKVRVAVRGHLPSQDSISIALVDLQILQ